MPLIKRHREINNLMKEKGLWEELHALQVKAWTGVQWAEKNGG
jgi:stress-induced morphogen